MSASDEAVPWEVCMNKLNKKRMIIASGLATTLIALVLLVTFALSGSKEQVVKDESLEKETEQVVTEKDVDKPSVSSGSLKDHLFKVQAMSITANEVSDGAIKRDTSFLIKVKGDLELEDLERHLKVSNKQAYKLVQQSKGSEEGVFELSFDQPLPAGKVVSMVFDKVDQPFGFAFQTEKSLKVSSIYPAEDAWSVPTNALIEIRFTKSIELSVTDFIDFSPSIEGRFEVSDNLCRFIPSQPLAPNTGYEVSISEGYSQEGEPLEAFKTYFETQYTGDYNDGGFTFSGGDLVYMNPTGSMVFTGYNNTYKAGEQVQIQAYKLQEISDFLSRKHLNIEEMTAMLPAEDSVTLTATLDDQSYRSKLVIDDGLPLGYYYFVIDDGISYDGQLVHVTNYNAYALADTDQILVWLQNSAGLSNQCNVIIDNDTFGTTDASGLLNHSMTVPQDAKIQVVVETEERDDFYITLNTWGYEASIDQDYWLFFETDRPVYLPTDEAVVSGFIAHKDGDSLSQVTVRFRHNNVILSEETVPVSPLGNYMTTFAWEDLFNYGMSIEVLIGDQVVQRAYIAISQFEKPTYKISLETEEKVIRMGDTLHIQGLASYFEGTPLSQPTVTIGGSWGMDIGGGFDETITTKGDDQGYYSYGLVPYFNTTNWRPSHKSISVGLGDIDTYYDRTYTNYTIVPRDTMVTSEVDETDYGFLTMVTMNEIEVGKITNTYDDYDVYRGDEVINHPATIEVYDHYYEEIYQGQKYDAVMKVFYDDYTYLRHDDLIHSNIYETNEYGKIAMLFYNVEEGHRYEVKIITHDSEGDTIIETTYYGDEWYYDRTYNANPYLQLEMDQYECALGEEVTAYISYDGNQYAGNDRDRALFISVEDGIEMISVIEDTALTFNYPSKLVTGVEVKAVYFNGQSIRQVYSYYTRLSIDHASRTLNVDVSVDQEAYRPGEKVTGSVSVTYEDGSAAKGFVDMKVVDEAYYALFYDNYNPLEDLLAYNYNTEILGEAYAASNWDDTFYGAEGGEGGEGAFRSEFKNTAYTGHLNLDAMGSAEFAYDLPDNLTQWRMTFGAIDPDIYAGTAQKNIDATLPFHISLMSTETFTYGDDVGITLKSASKKMEDSEVTYTIEIEKDNEKVFETQVVGDVQGYVYVPVGKLELGSYRLKVSARSGAYQDGIQHDMEVVESRQHITMMTEDVLHESMEVTHNNQMVSLQFMNELAWERYLEVRSLLGGNKDRTEYAVASYLAKNYMEGKGLVYPAFDDDRYEPFIGRGNNDLFRPLDNSDGDVVTTVDILEMGWLVNMETYEVDRLSRALKNRIESQEGHYSEDAAALYGLALMGEPVLLQLHELLMIEDYTNDSIARLYLIKGLTALGDYSKALAYLESFGYLEGAEALSDNDTPKSQALLMTIYSDLNMAKEAESIYQVVTALTKLEEPIIAQKLYYLTHLPTNILDVSFEMVYGEHREVIQLDYNDIHSITLTKEEADSVEFQEIDGSIRVLSQFIGDHRDVVAGEGLKVTSTIGSRHQIGEAFRITHHVEVKNGMRNYALHDVIPAGTVMVGQPEFSSSEVLGSVYLDSEGKNATIYGYLYSNEFKSQLPRTYDFEVTYTVRATSIGSYVYEPVVLQDYKHRVLAVGDESYVSIAE